MKAKATKPLTSKQLKARNNYDRISITSLPTKKGGTLSTSNIDINHYIAFNVDKLSEIIKQIEIVQKGLKILASEVKTLK